MARTDHGNRKETNATPFKLLAQFFDNWSLISAKQRRVGEIHASRKGACILPGLLSSPKAGATPF